jgi:hypothetical protein
MDTSRFSRIIGWIQKRQHHISTLVFLGGFLLDIATLTFLDLQQVELLFTFYLVIVTIASFINHLVDTKVNEENTPKFYKTASVISALTVQFFVSGLLSGFLIFYTKSSSLLISWPFLLLLALIFLGNEFLREYRYHLTFQTVLLYFSFYAFSIFAVPVFLGKLGPSIFLISTGIAIAALAAYLFFLRLLDTTRFRTFLMSTIIACTVCTGIVVGSYFLNLIPPLPLTLKDGGVYQSVVRTASGYDLAGGQTEKWWDPRTPQIVIASDGSLSAYTSIFAPVAFTAGIEHEWDWYNPKSRTWEEQALIAFGLTGGREQGYRGYSTKTAVTPGSWRVKVMTQSGQVIGTLRFTAVQ